MTNIMNNKSYHIEKTSDYSYTLLVKDEYKNEIYLSLLKTKIINNLIIDDETNKLYFNCESIVSLNTYLKNQNNNKMTENQCIKMISDISKQIKYLKIINYCFYGFDLDDILVINNNTFFIASAMYLLPMDDSYIILFDKIFVKPYFNSPEILQLTNLPSKITYSSTYYSLGLLVTYCLLNQYLLVANEIKSPNEIEDILKPIFYSKIYWFLKRCLNENCEERKLLLI
jgi:hypothetical protein